MTVVWRESGTDPSWQAPQCLALCIGERSTPLSPSAPNPASDSEALQAVSATETTVSSRFAKTAASAVAISTTRAVRPARACGSSTARSTLLNQAVSSCRSRRAWSRSPTPRRSRRGRTSASDWGSAQSSSLSPEPRVAAVCYEGGIKARQRWSYNSIFQRIVTGRGARQSSSLLSMR